VPGGFGHHQSGHFFTERKGMVGSEEPMVTRVEVEKQFSDFEKHIFFSIYDTKFCSTHISTVFQLGFRYIYIYIYCIYIDTHMFKDHAHE